MENVRHYRAMGSVCRELAMFDPVHSWKYLIEAQTWEHRAEAEIASHFNECNNARSGDLAKLGATHGSNYTRLLTVSYESWPRVGCSFFFSSRRRHTRSDRDWSSDCALPIYIPEWRVLATLGFRREACSAQYVAECTRTHRSEERRVGKECRSRWSPYH